MFDAKETLDTFMVDGMPDAELFQKSVGQILTETKKEGTRQGPRLDCVRRDGGGTLGRRQTQSGIGAGESVE